MWRKLTCLRRFSLCTLTERNFHKPTKPNQNNFFLFFFYLTAITSAGHTTPLFSFFCKCQLGFIETKKLKRLNHKRSFMMSAVSHTLSDSSQAEARVKVKNNLCSGKALGQFLPSGPFGFSTLRWHRGWCVGVVYTERLCVWLACRGWGHIYLNLSNWHVGIDGGTESLCTEAANTEPAPWVPTRWACHPITHNHSTELKDTSPPSSPHPHTPNRQQNKQQPQTHMHTQTIKHTKSLLISPPHPPTQFYQRPHTVLGEVGGRAIWGRGFPDDPPIPPWTIGSHSVVSIGGLVMCHSWLLCYWTTVTHTLHHYC